MPDKSVFKLITNYDALETLNQPGKWPRVFTCVIEECNKCNMKLTPVTNKKQKNKTDKKMIVTKLHVIVNK